MRTINWVLSLLKSATGSWAFPEMILILRRADSQINSQGVLCAAPAHKPYFASIWGVRRLRMLKMTTVTPPSTFQKNKIPGIPNHFGIPEGNTKTGFFNFAQNWYRGVLDIRKTENDFGFSENHLQSPVEAIGRF